MKNFTRFLTALFCLIGTTAFAVPKLNSLPTAAATIYLDFDGHLVTGSLWNSGNPIACVASGMTDAQITEIFNRVSEDYRPFNINITTDSTKFLSAPIAQRMRVIITPTSSWKTGVGGIAYTGSFTWGDDTPAFVFCDRLGPNNPKFVAECCSHESGHTVGLSHQSKYDESCNLTETYNTGSGTGETSWAPIMGNSYSRNMTGWNNGPTPYGCTNTQDNLSIITSTNGFGYRADDYSDSLNNNAHNPGNNSFSVNGLISTSNDRDVFKFNFPQATTLHIDANPYSLGTGNSGSNLDIKIMLYDQNKVLLRTYDPMGSMAVTIDTSLKSGTYFLAVDGTGNSFASNYGSLGSYTFTGFRSALPIHEVTLTGSVENSKHKLNWNIVSDEPVKSLDVEFSTDGRQYSSLNAASVTSKTMMYEPYDVQTRYYRIKAVSQTDQIVYSNVVALRGITKADMPFTVSTFVTHLINVNASENFRYLLLDANGRAVKSGNGFRGMNNIDAGNLPGGFYVIQLLGNTTKQSERIIRQ